MTQQQLKNLAVKWQAILRLLDWDIDVCFVPLHELKEDTKAMIFPEVQTKEATLKVLQESDAKVLYPNDPFDPENSIVHELIHVHLSLCEIPESRGREEEHVVRAITAALLRKE